MFLEVIFTIKEAASRETAEKSGFLNKLLRVKRLLVKFFHIVTMSNAGTWTI